MLEDSHRPRAKTEAWDFPLTGKLYDGRDGGLMTGTSGTGKSGRPYHYYRCRSCGRTVRRDVVEKCVADAVREALGSADSRERIARMLADAEEERADEKPLSETIKGELAEDRDGVLQHMDGHRVGHRAAGRQGAHRRAEAAAGAPQGRAAHGRGP